MITANFDADKLHTVPYNRQHHTRQVNVRHLTIPHHKVMRQLLREVEMQKDIDKRPYRVRKIKVGLSGDDTEMIAAIEVLPSDLKFPDGVSLWLGVLHSNSGRRASALYGGLTCDGVPVVCERYQIDKARGVHFDETGTYQLSEQLDNFVVQAGNFTNRVREMKKRYVSEPDGDLLLMRACRRKYLAWARLKWVEKTRRDQDKEVKQTVWGLYSAMAMATLTHGTPITQNPRMDQLSAMFYFREMVMEYRP